MSQKQYLGGSLLNRKCLSIQCLHDFEWIKDISSQENFQLLLELILVSINDFSAKCKKCRQISKEAPKKMLSEDQTQNVLSSTQVLNQNKSATTRKYKHEKHKTLGSSPQEEIWFCLFFNSIFVCLFAVPFEVTIMIIWGNIFHFSWTNLQAKITTHTMRNLSTIQLLLASYACMLRKGTKWWPCSQLGMWTNRHMQLLWKDSISRQEQQYLQKEGYLKTTWILQFISLWKTRRGQFELI